MNTISSMPKFQGVFFDQVKKERAPLEREVQEFNERAATARPVKKDSVEFKQSFAQKFEQDVARNQQEWEEPINSMGQSGWKVAMAAIELIQENGGEMDLNELVQVFTNPKEGALAKKDGKTVWESYALEDKGNVTAFLRANKSLFQVTNATVVFDKRAETNIPAKIKLSSDFGGEGIEGRIAVLHEKMPEELKQLLA